MSPTRYWWALSNRLRSRASVAPRTAGVVRRPAGERRTPTRGRRALTTAGALSLLVLTASACSREEATRLGMPEPISEQGQRVLALWQGSWIAALATGCLVWGLIIWAVLFHRKRSDDLPPQVRYNLPIEMLYTAVPFVIIAVLFYFTARDENYLQKTTANPAVVVDVTAFQWSWRFDYPQYNVSVVGTPAAPDDNPGNKPVLVVPTGETVRFNLHANDVIHSFWVPALLYKMDVMPGYNNKFEVTLNKTGTYEGRCAELCGVDHSRMLFQMKVVTPAEFQQFINTKKAAGGSQ